ncbi:BBE domain-containing protein [Mycobacterium tuberculosis]|nr:BBE domain-containing protein [Mycobacterium tuberculosis]
MDLVRYLAGGHTTYPPEGFVAGSDVIGTTNPAAAQAIVAAIGTWPPAAGRASAGAAPTHEAPADRGMSDDAAAAAGKVRSTAIVDRLESAGRHEPLNWVDAQPPSRNALDFLDAHTSSGTLSRAGCPRSPLPQAPRNYLMVTTTKMGGAVGDMDPEGSAFPWCRQSAVVQWYVNTPSDGQVATANKWLSDAHHAVQHFSVGGYVNYLEANAAASQYFGANLSRLTTVRRKYDPDRIMYSGLDFSTRQVAERLLPALGFRVRFGVLVIRCALCTDTVKRLGTLPNLTWSRLKVNVAVTQEQAGVMDLPALPVRRTPRR